MAFLNGISLRNYRGISDDFQTAAGFSKFNFFIGENNSGKSTFLEFIARYVSDIGILQQKTLQIERLENNISGSSIECRLGVRRDRGNDIKSRSSRRFNVQMQQNLDKILDSLTSDGLIWFESKQPFSELKLFNPHAVGDLASLLDSPNEWSSLWNALTGSRYGSLEGNWIPDILNFIDRSLKPSFPAASMIPAKRSIGPTGQNFADFSGVGLIDELAKIQNPDVDERPQRRIFEKINRFLATVLDKPNAEIEIPYERRHVLVNMDGRVLPLSSLGTGIHEVVLIAAFCTLSNDQIVCIEEPESHLHPKLQKKLIRYLDDNTDNQYFIATHSNAFMDEKDISIFHVRLKEGQTSVAPASSPDERHELCFELGYRPVDIIQANCIIWVEGPSDRIYLNHWIKSKSPDLREGLDYAVMFYGGRLLAHLSNDDDSMSQFINLRRLNNRSAIIVDSDKRSAHARINATKQRLKNEYSKEPGLCWVTKGREIENYVDYEVLQNAVKATHPSKYFKAHANGAYENALAIQRKNGDIDEQIDKIGVANRVVEKSPIFTILDLDKRVDEIIEFIKRSR